MANHSLPTLTSTYTNFLTEMGSRIDDAVKQGRSDTVTLTNPPVGAIRWNATSKTWEQNTGTVATPAWTALATSYGISITGDAGSVNSKTLGTFGAAGGILYATSTSAAAATAAGTSGQVLLSGAAGAPTWASQSTLAVGSATSATSATTATNLAGGVAGAIPYQSGAGASAFSAAGTTGQVLTSAGTAAPTWTAQSSLAVGSATTATNLAGGGAGTIPYQSAAGTTAQLAAGTSGYVLKSNGAAAPSWVATSTLDAGSTNGKTLGTFTAAGGVAYASSTTALAATAAGTAGQALISAGAGAPTWGTLGLSGGGVGATTQSGALQNLGAIASVTVAKSAAYTVVAGDRGDVLLCTGTWTLTLTAAATLANGFSFGVVNVGTGIITIDPNASETVDGLTTKPLSPGQSCILITDGTSWRTVGLSGGGAIGGGTDQVFYENGQTVTTNYSITSGKNAMSAGPITVANGITVTIPTGSFWTVV